MSVRSRSVLDATSRSLAELVDATVSAVGVDAVETEDFALDLQSEDPRAFLASVFLESELADCDGETERLAARFAAKEAALKALGTGIHGIDMTDVLICTASNGRPSIVLSPAASQVAADAGIGALHLSMTHEAGLAIAVVVGTAAHAPEHVGRDPR